MEKSYAIKVDENFDFTFTQEDISSLDVVAIGENTFHILKNGAAFNAEVITKDFGSRRYIVKINSTEYEVSVGTPLDVLIQEMGFASNGAKNVDSIMAPMPGLILEISIEEGEEVKEDQQLLVLEAMKMENIITSPRDGVVKKISVKQGDAVDKKQLLIEFE